MHLLKYGGNGDLAITSFNDDELPLYAILSHTWGADEEEVSFADIVNGSNKAKPGYEKIRLCGEQARQDRLEYFWIDTCCINKANKAELSLAIRSMFWWYRNAARCYVYLSDVSTLSLADDEGEVCAPLWDSAFRECLWFTRGWTLQELLAPSVVEFFSREWRRLGTRTSLKFQIHEVTTIPYQVLEGAHLSQYSVDERFRWRQNRHTKLREDAAYSLSGIFDVEIAPVYGEGTEEAFRRLHDKIRKQEESFQKREECLRHLRATDPRNDKTRIEETKGGLLADVYLWILNNTAFQQWRQDPHSRLLWVKGDPGKGKTMLLCGIINELQKGKNDTLTISYFFCQASDSRINTAIAVLRGLLYMLVDQQMSLVSHIRKKHDLAGESLFNDANAWVALTEIFVDVLQDPSLRTTYLIIDALDECVADDLSKLLGFVATQSSASSRVKWIISSRNWPTIEKELETAENQTKLSLELNADSVAAAVDVFIQQKVYQLAQEKQYKSEVRAAVLKHLTSNANNTFLWVALVCQDLKKTPKWNVLNKLASFPPGLDSLYKRMMHQISESDGAEICRQVLASTAILYRPVTVSELAALVEQLEDLDDLESVREIVGFCGSFLTLQEDTVYFVHQSAKDFLFAKAHYEAFPDGVKDIHWTIVSRSLAILSRTLRRDMYGLEAPGYPIENVKLSKVDPLAVSRYPCVYWIDHLCNSKRESLGNSVGHKQFADVLDKFLRKKYLYWLEGLSLCKSVGRGIVSIENLWLLVQVCCTTSACLESDLDANASRRCVTKIDLLSLFKTHDDSSCITKGLLRATLFRHMYPRSCSVQQVV
jgi:archaellum biogenesis ATPase FlaH